MVEFVDFIAKSFVSQTSHDQEKAPTKSLQNDLPDGVCNLAMQISGHFHGAGKLGMLQTSDGWVLKPVQSPPRGTREVRFYETVFNEECSDTILTDLRQLLPRYAGMCQFRIGSSDVTFFKMENVLNEFRHPCVIDIKVGPRTYDPEADQAKIDYEISKSLQAQQIGFRFLGMKLYNWESNSYVSLGKQWGKLLKEQDVHPSLLQFLGACCCRSYKLQVLEEFLHALKNVQRWFKVQRKYVFYASSLLLAYESCVPQHSSDSGSCPGLSSATAHKKSSKQLPVRMLTDVRMIDFAHVCLSNLLDDNYLFGLNRLIAYLTDIQSAV